VLIVATIPHKPLFSWMDTLVDYVRSGEPDLTNRQMALLMVVYLRPGPHTVRGLARCLNVSKPVVTRALNRLGALGYLRRQRDDSDKRNIFVAPTSEGAEFLEEFGHFIGDEAEQPSQREPERRPERERAHA
jgi:DNA-binding MarR family transcriptional regulator